MKREKLKSYFMLIGAMLIFGSIGLFRRNLDISSGVIAFARGFLGGIFLLLFSAVNPKKQFRMPSKKNICYFGISGAIMGLNWIFLFEAYTYTTVATATMCYYMMPTIVILLSPIIFKNKLSLHKLICAIVGLIGIGLISGFGSNIVINLNTFKGILYGLSAAVLYASVVILNKHINTDDLLGRTTIQLFSAGIVLLPYLILSGQIQDLSYVPSDLLLLLIMGIIHTGVAYLLYFASIHYLDANSIAILSYIDPVFALFISVFIMEEPITRLGVLGTVLIIFASAASELSPTTK